MSVVNKISFNASDITALILSDVDNKTDFINRILENFGYLIYKSDASGEKSIEVIDAIEQILEKRAVEAQAQNYKDVLESLMKKK